MKKPDQKTIDEFLRHSNWIEDEYSQTALEDARKAWRYAYGNINAKLNIKHILEIHRLLMENLRPDIAGKLRNCNVWIGGQLKLFVSKSALKQELQGICRSINSEIPQGPEFPKNAHIAFENIHPFEDGNGRIGRIIYNLHRLKIGLPIHIIHQGDEQIQYYQWFK